MKRALLAALLVALPAFAHKASDSYLALSVEGKSVTAQWDLALRDLAEPLALDANGDGKITWGELQARQAEIAAWALAHLTISAEGRPCAPGPVALAVDAHSDGSYAVLRFALQCAAEPAALGVHYSLLFDSDALHRGLLRLTAGGETRTAVFAPKTASQSFELRGQLASFVRAGALHVFSSAGHLLFLLALLVPCVLRRQKGGWAWAARFPPAIADAARVVAAFAVAHSITLSMAAFGFAHPPQYLVEAGIALSVSVAALDNLVPVIGARRWAVAFAFGLLHGFGFARSLLDGGLPRAGLLQALFSFNLGIELAVLAVAIVFLEGAFALRGSPLRLSLAAPGRPHRP